MEPLSEKEIKRQGFQIAENRYQELLPLLSRLNELEEDQKQDERFYEKKNSSGHRAEKERGGAQNQKPKESQQKSNSKQNQKEDSKKSSKKSK